MSDYSAKKWTHPGNGEVRIYLNHPLLEGGHKLFITKKNADDVVVSDFEINAKSPSFTSPIEDKACDIMSDCFGGLDFESFNWDNFLKIAA